MKYISITLSLLVLAACADPAAEYQERYREAESAIDSQRPSCKALPKFYDQVKCLNGLYRANLIPILRNPSGLQLILAEAEENAILVDKREITKDEYLARMGVVEAKVGYQESQERRMIAAQILANTPHMVSTHCNTIGTSTQCSSY